MFVPVNLRSPKPLIVSAPFVVEPVAPGIVPTAPAGISKIAVTPVLIVNALSVVKLENTCKVPPLKTILVAALVAFPKLLTSPPLDIRAARNVPSESVVTPEYELLTLPKYNVPDPILVRAPVVLAAVPLMLKVVPLVEISKVATLELFIVNALFVDAVAPVYFKVPPSNTRFPAILVACPKLPATPPSPIVATLNVPSDIVVTPV